MHNEDYIKEKDIREGDIVSIIKAGDVIPRVEESIKERRKEELPEFKMTTTCPICNSPLKKIDASYYCTNENCDAKNIEKIIHYASRDAMNIEGFGDQIVEDFYNMGYLKNITDFYTLYKYKEELMELEGFGEKSINQLLKSIEQSKSNSLERLLFGLGIRYVGNKTAKILAKQYGSIETLIEVDFDALIEVKDIGATIAKSIKEFFNNEENKALINKLREFGLNTYYIGKNETTDETFTNKTFVITGTLEKYKRNELKEIIENKGGTVSESVSKKTSIVIVGENPGSKYEKAKELGITIWREEELDENLGGK